MCRRLILGLTALCAPLLSVATDTLPADTRTVLGQWVGTYTCAQGLTGLTLTLTEATPTRAQALFHFYADPRNPRVPTGCFTMTGRYDAATGQLALRGGQWLLRPSGYRVVSFNGLVDARGQAFEGKVAGPAGCTTFALSRQPSPAPATPACQLADAPAAQTDAASAGRIADALVAEGRIDLNILFDFGRASLRTDDTRQLDELGRILMSPDLAQRRIGIHGHTDGVGTAEANRVLSLQRATTVRDYLVRHFKAEASRFEVEGHGKDRLKLPQSPEDGANRRVEILLLGPAAPGRR